MINDKRALLCLIDHIGYVAGRLHDNIDTDDEPGGTTFLTNREADDLVGRLDCAVTLLCHLAGPDKHSSNVRMTAAEYVLAAIEQLPPSVG